MNEITKIKAARYYLSRFLFWRVFFVIILAIGIEFLGSYSKIFDYDENFIMPLVFLPLNIVCFHVALKKVFFKPYKHIVLTPKFSKLTMWFTVKTLFKVDLITFGFSTLLFAMAKVFFSIPMIICRNTTTDLQVSLATEMFDNLFVPLDLLAFLLILLIVINKIIRKNTTIKAKTNSAQ